MGFLLHKKTKIYPFSIQKLEISKKIWSKIFHTFSKTFQMKIEPIKCIFTFGTAIKTQPVILDRVCKNSKCPKLFCQNWHRGLVGQWSFGQYTTPPARYITSKKSQIHSASLESGIWAEIPLSSSTETNLRFAFFQIPLCRFWYGVVVHIRYPTVHSWISVQGLSDTLVEDLNTTRLRLVVFRSSTRVSETLDWDTTRGWWDINYDIWDKMQFGVLANAK